jgi:hypothetical protein
VVPALAKIIDVSPSPTTKADLIEDLGTRLGVPEYYGANWDALDESLRDLGWVPEHAVVIRHAATERGRSGSDLITRRATATFTKRTLHQADPMHEHHSTENPDEQR